MKYYEIADLAGCMIVKQTRKLLHERGKNEFSVSSRNNAILAFKHCSACFV